MKQQTTDELYSYRDKEPVVGHFLYLAVNGRKYYILQTMEMYLSGRDLCIKNNYSWSYTDHQHGEKL